uniref:Uncharacterized protein n=1 Tax=Anopheles dirus TaxID=7168 RepID=A0A182NW49_9DIPT
MLRQYQFVCLALTHRTCRASTRNQRNANQEKDVEEASAVDSVVPARSCAVW